MASFQARTNKDGEISYQIKVSRGRDKLTGKQLTPFTTTYRPPHGWSEKKIKRELLRFIGEFEAACKRGEVLTKEQKQQQELERLEQMKREKEEQERKPTFNQYIPMFSLEKESNNATGTCENYRIVLERAAAFFGETKIEDIDTLSVRKYITDLQTHGKNKFNGEPLAHGTIIKHYIVLHSFFQSAVENNIISTNPMQNMKRPKPRKDEVPKEPIVYTEKEVQSIIACLNKEPLKWRALIMFAIDSGCRRGEIVGLKWENVDFKTGKVTICNNAQYTAGKGTYITTPKNGKSRVIYLNKEVLSVMAEWKMNQTTLHIGQGISQSEFCFTGNDGDMMNPQAPTAYLKRFGEKYGFPGIHPHALRHTMATVSISNGADIVSVSKRLGHSNTSITLDVYSHANEEAQQRATAILANALYEKKKA